MGTQQQAEQGFAPTPPKPTSSSEDAAQRRHIRGPFAVAAVTLGLVTWPVAFNYGAYDVIVYSDVLLVVVASSILFIITFTEPVYGPRWIWLVRVALIAPLVWLLTAGYLVGSTTAALDRLGYEIWLVGILVVSVPVTFRLLVDLFVPELTQVGSRRVTFAIVAIVATVSIAGFVVGRQNSRFLVCADFEIAGDAAPENCRSTDQ